MCLTIKWCTGEFEFVDSDLARKAVNTLVYLDLDFLQCEKF